VSDRPADASVAWTQVTRPGAVARVASGPVPTSRVVLQVAGAAVVVLLVVAALGVAVVRRIAEREAVNDAAQLTDLLARAVVTPALDDGLLDGDPTARSRLDDVVRGQVLDDRFVRVKVWSPEGRVLYSDADDLIGETYPLGDEEREVLSAPATVAEVSDLDRPENRLERGQGRLLEVYRPVWTPAGRPLLFETYTRYSTVTARTGDLWRGFGGIIVSSLLLFVVLVSPVLWALLDRLRRARGQRELLLRHALDASEEERRRIAADLHDGVVQEFVAASLVVAGSADRIAAAGARDVADRLVAAAASMRASVGALRTLLVDIYPRNLDSAGIAPVLEDLAAGLRGRGVTVSVDVDPEVAERLSAEERRLVYRTVRECLRNTARHARAHTAWVTLRAGGPDADATVRLEVGDDGVGLDPATADEARAGGHLGLRLLADLATDHGATLWLATAPDRGTRWRLEVASD
jgi:two-component system NarL family sensor kinase